jgi:cytochrome b
MTTELLANTAITEPTPKQVKVWDPLVRVFHWSLASFFLIAYVTEEDFLALHTWAGYAVLGLILVRVLWGFVGTRYARFSSFVFSPRQVVGFLKDTLRLRARRYIGHNPAGGAMILLLLASLLITTVSGIALLGVEENAGPLASWFAGSGEFWEDALEGLHEFFANFTVLLVVVHVGGVIVESLLHRENLVRAMFTGFKRAQ